ncbi:F0F1 ATP synthase subunit gamma [Candidatus Dependentiae bacterium]|nr:F0F1 ATP synthase subunit gamma [Candidatus Dependentiae bacterium]MBU4387321.1 F0F1 ATP synthase subunit gamma [Candidatus Dependentiae bacterium]MCG2756214.1 F0F1 ATP synthase subunit gamma [Candidatus Dependentiae bacterium]
MAQLTQLRRKIQAIETTKKITHAIRLVSMASYAKLDKQVNFLKEYKNSISNTFTQILNFQESEWNNKILFPEDIFDQTPLIIIISSTKGLCGSFNSNLSRFMERKLIIEKNQKPEFIAIGNKARKEIEAKNLGEIVLNFNELNYSLLETISSKIIDKIYENNKTYSSVVFFSNKLINFFIQRPQKTTLIPAVLEIQEEQNLSKELDPIITQNEKVILDFIAEKYIKSSITEILFQSLIAENASRFLAMDSSNTNAKKILERLTLQYNKSRQALITKEVSELCANIE